MIPLKDKKGVTITNGFQKILGKCRCKPNEMWVGKGSEFYNKSMKSWIQDNVIEMYSTHMKENLLFLIVLLGPLGIKSRNICLQYQKMYIDNRAGKIRFSDARKSMLL